MFHALFSCFCLFCQFYHTFNSHSSFTFIVLGFHFLLQWEFLRTIDFPISSAISFFFFYTLLCVRQNIGVGLKAFRSQMCPRRSVKKDQPVRRLPLKHEDPSLELQHHSLRWDWWHAIVALAPRKQRWKVPAAHWLQIS